MRWSRISILSQKYLVGSAMIALALLGVWLGEGSFAGIPEWPELTAAIAALIWPLFLKTSRLRSKFILIAFSAGIFVLGDIFGRYEFDRAYDECHEQGEAIRKDLGLYKETYKKYPQEIEELVAVNADFPGELLLRGSILNYHRTTTGYEISFRDWLVIHSATETEKFHAFQ